MSLLFLVLLIIGVGCVPPLQYEAVKKELSASQEERNALKKKLNQCEAQNKKLAEEIRSPIKKTIEPKELEEIKKKAFDETDKKYRIRIQRKAPR